MITSEIDLGFPANPMFNIRSREAIKQLWYVISIHVNFKNIWRAVPGRWLSHNTRYTNSALKEALRFCACAGYFNFNFQGVMDAPCFAEMVITDQVNNDNAPLHRNFWVERHYGAECDKLSATESPKTTKLDWRNWFVLRKAENGRVTVGGFWYYMPCMFIYIYAQSIFNPVTKICMCGERLKLHKEEVIEKLYS